MERKAAKIKKILLLLAFLCILPGAALLAGGCRGQRPVSAPAQTKQDGQTEQNGQIGPDDGQKQGEPKKETLGEDLPKELSPEEIARLTKGNVRLSAEQLSGYASDMTLRYDREQAELVYSLTTSWIPESDDPYLYLFAKRTYEEETLTGEKPVAYGYKGTACEIHIPYEDAFLFSRFIPALLVGGDYVALGEGMYLSNPEALAQNQEAYPEMASKKGLLLDPSMLGTEELTDLGVKHAIYNIPLSSLLGETTEEKYPTILYTYEGKEYAFNGYTVASYDALFSYLTQLGMCSTAIVLNDWNEEHPELIHPEARNEDSGAYYYMLNAAQEEGVLTLEAVARFLTERYCGGEHGMVHNWVVANEINQKIWNYMDTEDLDHYAEEFEKGFRIFYQAARSAYAQAKVYFSVDHVWNNDREDHSQFFDSRDLIEAFQRAVIKHGNYDWGLAIHPYPDPLSRVNFWSQTYDKTQAAKTLSIMNLNVLTDFLGQKPYLDTQGRVRSIAITELGFSSRSGEKLQAAAFAYCYYIVEANPYIEAFMMNRQTDAPEEMMQGLAFGIYEYDHSPKYLKEVFSNIDTDNAEEYTDFMLNILKAEDLEEALSWAE